MDQRTPPIHASAMYILDICWHTKSLSKLYTNWIATKEGCIAQPSSSKGKEDCVISSIYFPWRLQGKSNFAGWISLKRESVEESEDLKSLREHWSHGIENCRPDLKISSFSWIFGDAASPAPSVYFTQNSFTPLTTLIPCLNFRSAHTRNHPSSKVMLQVSWHDDISSTPLTRTLHSHHCASLGTRKPSKWGDTMWYPENPSNIIQLNYTWYLKVFGSMSMSSVKLI